MERLFCKCFNATDLSRSDTAYDAKINNIGIGLKTFICSKNSIEKIAEFNANASELRAIKRADDLALKLSELRNERIRFANRLYNINNALYHIIARDTNKLLFFETDYKPIDLNTLKIIKNTKSTLSFQDSLNEYFFNYSKSVLQMRFILPPNAHALDINILSNPFDLLLKFDEIIATSEHLRAQDYIVLPLYSLKNNKPYVPLKSGLNHWNAGGRSRKIDEIYLPLPSLIVNDKKRGFFPDISFNLHIPNGQILQAKICQDNNKALMTNPNKALAQWLLRDVLDLKEGELLSYEKLKDLSFDSVIITKLDDENYKISKAKFGDYERFIQGLA